MRQIATFLVLFACCTAVGGATGLQGIALLATAGQGVAPSAFSQFASEVQNYSAGAAPANSSESPQTLGTSPDSDALPLAPGPEAVADTGTEAGSDPVPRAEPADHVQRDPPPDTSDASDPAPSAPGPEAIAGFGLEAASEPVRETESVIRTDTSADSHAEPQADAQSDALLAPEVYLDPGPEPTFAAEIADVASETIVAADQREAIPAPQADGSSPFKPGGQDGDIDRFTRRVADVPLDIRPVEGVMPEDLAAAQFEEHAQGDPRQSHDVEPIFCSYTPWTICFRPLYFEEVALERLGQKRRFSQPLVSGVHFFSSVALLPYKMRVRPPRSCVCSNGFSRVGDCPPPGYGECVWRWDAALVQAAAVTGFVFILP